MTSFSITIKLSVWQTSLSETKLIFFFKFILEEGSYTFSVGTIDIQYNEKKFVKPIEEMAKKSKNFHRMGENFLCLLSHVKYPNIVCGKFLLKLF